MSVNNNNYWLSNCELSIGVIPITSLSKLLVGVKPGDEFSSIGLIGVIPVTSLSNVFTAVYCGCKFLTCPLNHPFPPPKFPVDFNSASSSADNLQVVTNLPVDFLNTAITCLSKS